MVKQELSKCKSSVTEASDKLMHYCLLVVPSSNDGTESSRLRSGLVPLVPEWRVAGAGVCSDPLSFHVTINEALTMSDSMLSCSVNWNHSNAEGALDAIPRDHPAQFR